MDISKMPAVPKEILPLFESHTILMLQCFTALAEHDEYPEVTIPSFERSADQLESLLANPNNLTVPQQLGLYRILHGFYGTLMVEAGMPEHLRVAELKNPENYYMHRIYRVNEKIARLKARSDK